MGKQKEKFPLFSIVLLNLQQLVSLKLIDQFWGDFQLNVTLVTFTQTANF